jgi:hypothetical protein
MTSPSLFLSQFAELANSTTNGVLSFNSGVLSIAPSTGSTLPWSSITSTPTTLAGYGISSSDPALSGFATISSVTSSLASAGTQIQTITATVATNALTVGLAASTLAFRSPSLSSGIITTITSGALSLTIPAGATLGTSANVAANFAILALNYNGVVQLGIVNIAGGLPLLETGLISTTAISSASSASNVVYSTIALTSVPFRVVGYITVTEIAAGTWATAPTLIQGVGGLSGTQFSSIGYGQTWVTTFSPVRAINTTYYNTTGKPILVSISVVNNNSAAENINALVNGVVIVTSGTSFGGSTANVTFIVPVGSSYSYTGQGTQVDWSELR